MTEPNGDDAEDEVIWKTAVGLNGRIEVSNRGELRERIDSGIEIITPRTNQDGYPVKWHRGRWRLVHRIVLFTFIGPPPEGFVAMHLNRVRDDNRLTNLVWRPPSEAMRTHDGKHHLATILSPEQIEAIRNSSKRPAELQREYKTSYQTILKIRAGKTHQKKIRRLTNEERLEIAASEEDPALLAAKYGVTVSTITNTKEQSKYRDITKTKHVTAAELEQILESKESARVLAEKFGVSPGTIRNIRVGKTYAGRREHSRTEGKNTEEREPAFGNESLRPPSR